MILCKSSFWNICSLVPRPVTTLDFIVSEPLAKILYDNLAGLSGDLVLNILSIEFISPFAILLYTFVRVLLLDDVCR